mgnify:FL=1
MDHECCQTVTETVKKEETVKEETTPDTESKPNRPHPQASRRGANVGPNVTPGKGNWFAGTSWGD